MGTVFENAVLVQLDPPMVETGALRVAEGKIASLGASVAAEPDDERVDCGGAALKRPIPNPAA